MIEAIWDGAELNSSERDHLSLCKECQRQYDMLAQMQDEFEIAHLSEVNAAAEERLFAIFDEVVASTSAQSALQKLFGAITGWVNALPLFDSRQQMVPTGIRNVNRSSYRMLFGTDETEIELMVEPHNGLLRVMGEVMVGDRDGGNSLALIELAASVDAKTALETASDVDGRFALDKVPPGVYLMTITPRYSPVIVIEALELT